MNENAGNECQGQSGVQNKMVIRCIVYFVAGFFNVSYLFFIIIGLFFFLSCPGGYFYYMKRRTAIFNSVNIHFDI